MVEVQSIYIAAGGNRHPAAADWDKASGLLAFGAGANVAIWDPLDIKVLGITSLLQGHSDAVNVVRFFPAPTPRPIIISGSVDKSIRIWVEESGSPSQFVCRRILTDHQASVNCIAVCEHFPYFLSGSADASVILWSLSVLEDSSIEAQPVQRIELKPRFFPLALEVHSLGPSKGTLVLAVAGTNSSIQIYVAGSADVKFDRQASLSGHEGWIRSLAFAVEPISQNVILASASQDKYIRLWNFQEVHDPMHDNPALHSDPRIQEKVLSNRAHRLKSTQGAKYLVTFEALLLGHDDWVYSASWKKTPSSLNLLTASADNTLSTWEADKATGIWISTARLGEISAQKGATTATGSAGGYWTGLWSPDGASVVSLGKTGGWRLWTKDLNSAWKQRPAISGHTKAVKGIAWSKGAGSYLLSTGSDQTTRLFAEWKRKSDSSWHEFSRPQIHGYDLNCVDTISASSFVSGADEKLLRVFDMPKALGNTLHNMCQAGGLLKDDMPEPADMPVLGLSNKAIQPDDDDTQPEVEDYHQPRKASKEMKSTPESTSDHPPWEDSLSKHTLWPEKEKLYGHGYEISAATVSNDGRIIATACRASSIDHAVIRLFRTRDWREVASPLRSHSLTVTRLRFSPDDTRLLSVGRDRQWAVFRRDTSDDGLFILQASKPKGHSRMILDASWAPLSFDGDSNLFATAGRDKTVKLWQRDDEDFKCADSYLLNAIPTAVAFLPNNLNAGAALAIALENGLIKIALLHLASEVRTTWYEFDQSITPLTSINEIAWQPQLLPTKNTHSLAAASEDHSIRIYEVKGLDVEF